MPHKTLIALICTFGSALPLQAKDLDLVDLPTGYYDNRSTPKDVVLSYYNALALQQYARAFSYGLRGTPEDPADALAAAYESFRDSFDPDSTVQLRLTETFSDAGVGKNVSAYAAVVALTSAAGETKLFAGCHYVVARSPADQDYAPFDPIRIDHTEMEPAGASLIRSRCRIVGSERRD